MRVLPSTNQTCPATNQVVAGCETLLQTVESSSTFCNKIRACCGFYRPKTNLFRVWRDSRVILSTSQTCLATNQLVAGWETLLQTVESSSTFCNKIRACCGFYRPKTNLFRVWRDSRVILSTSQTCLATNQLVAGWETLLQTVESSSTFCSKLRACCGFNRPQTNLSRVWRDSRVILSNQKTVFTELVTTWFVARKVWTWLVKHVTSQIFFRLICNSLHCNYHCDDHIFI